MRFDRRRFFGLIAGAIAGRKAVPAAVEVPPWAICPVPPITCPPCAEVVPGLRVAHLQGIIRNLQVQQCDRLHNLHACRLHIPGGDLIIPDLAGESEWFLVVGSPRFSLPLEDLTS